MARISSCSPLPQGVLADQLFRGFLDVQLFKGVLAVQLFREVFEQTTVQELNSPAIQGFSS